MTDPTRANQLLAIGKHSFAVSLYTKIIKKNASPLVFCNRAIAYFQLELFKHCVRDCDAALKLRKGFLRAYVLKGEALERLGNSKKALSTWNEGLSSEITESTDMTAYFLLKEKVRGSTLSEPSDGGGGATKRLGSSGGDEPIPATSLHSEVASRGLVQHGVGDTSIDEQIALGYLHVNTGRLEHGLRLFDRLIASHPRVVAAYIGRGTAYALMGNLSAAISDFTAALRLDDKCIDALKRRAQCLAASGESFRAQLDLTRAFQLNPDSGDSDLWYQQGLVLFGTKDYSAAAEHFERARNLEPRSKLSWNHLGLCQTALGMANEALAAFQQATQLDPGFLEAWTNLAQAYKELGRGADALRHFTISLKLVPTHTQTLHLRGMCRFAQGDHTGAVKDWSAALKADAKHKDSRWMRGVARHGLGHHADALKDYIALLKLQPRHHGWYNKEVLLYTHARLDTACSTFNMDREMSPSFKEGWCKRLDPVATLPHYEEQPTLDKSIPDVAVSPKQTDELKRICEASMPIGSKIQLSCAGYMSNARQHAAAGLAALEIAQRLAAEWKSPGATLVGAHSGSVGGEHPFGWRDMYDIAVRWRQISEPNDPVWWVDLLSAQQFAEGFGSHTPMVTGQSRVVRYSPMSSRAIRIMRDLMMKHPHVQEDTIASLSEANTCKELHDAIGRDFWVVTPCMSTARPGKVMEGTRLTLQYVAPNGYEHSIRTPGTPPRWKEYEYEMDTLWKQLVEASAQSPRDLDHISELILTITFYWYNFMPLSRGTAAVGFIALLGMFLSFDVEITACVPKGQQVDWEGILRPEPSQFIEQISPWLYPARETTSLTRDTPLVQKHIKTYRNMVEALNAVVAMKK